MSKILVTGGAGFIGSNLVKDLVAQGHQVLVLDNLSTGSLDNLQEVKSKIEFINGSSGDCLNINQLTGLDGIFHLGMASSSPLYKENHFLTGSTINDFIAILELAKRENCKLVFASTSSIYNGCPTPFREDAIILPKDYYSETRLFMEHLSQMYFNLWQVRSIGLRFLSVYGPFERAKKNLANMVSQIIWWIEKNQAPIFYGNGGQSRDFVYVKDVVDSLCLAMASKIENDVFNVATGKSYSFNEVVAIVNKLLNKDIKPVYQENPIQNYFDHHLADTSKAKNVLGFQAKYSLEQGIKELLEHEKNLS